MRNGLRILLVLTLFTASCGAGVPAPVVVDGNTWIERGTIGHLANVVSYDKYERTKACEIASSTGLTPGPWAADAAIAVERCKAEDWRGAQEAAARAATLLEVIQPTTAISDYPSDHGTTSEGIGWVLLWAVLVIFILLVVRLGYRSFQGWRNLDKARKRSPVLLAKEALLMTKVQRVSERIASANERVEAVHAEAHLLTGTTSMWVGLLADGKEIGLRVKAPIAIDGNGIRFGKPVILPDPEREFDEVGIWENQDKVAPMERLSAEVHADRLEDGRVEVGKQIGA